MVGNCNQTARRGIVFRIIVVITLIGTFLSSFPVVAQESEYVQLSLEASYSEETVFFTGKMDLQKCESVVGFTLFLYYDASVFSLQSFVPCSSVSGADVSHDVVAGRIRMDWDGAEPLVNDEILLFEGSFALTDHAYEGIHEFYFYAEECYGANLEDIPCESESYRVFIGEPFQLYQTELSLLVGESALILGNKEIDEWISQDESVAFIDEDQTVCAVAPGVVEIVAYSGEETDRLLVTVENEAVRITSGVYEVDEDFVNRIAPDTTVEQFKSNIIGGANICIYDPVGELVVTGRMKTGYEICAVAYGIVTDRLLAVVTGDINADGRCNILDLICVKKTLALFNENYSEAQYYAVTGRKNSAVAAEDMARLQRRLLWM